MVAALTSPHLIDLILLFTAVEALVLGHNSHHRVAIGLMLLPGICLLLALRAALAGVAWPWTPAALTLALIAHLLDLRQRWRN